MPNPGPPASPVPQAVSAPEGASTPAPADAAGPPATSATCRGDAPRELRAELSRRAGEGKDCYESYLREGNKGEGRLMVAVKIRGDGQVIGSAVMSDEIGSPALAECVLARFRPPVPTPPEGNCVDVQIPIRLSMKRNQ